VTTLFFLLVFRVMWAQSPPLSRDDKVVQLVADLANEVRQLRIEVATLSLELHKRRMQTLEQEIQATERERRLAEFDEVAGHDQIVSAETQLAGRDLDSAERLEIAALRDALVSDQQASVRRKRSETAEREASLRKEWESERAAADEARRTRQALLTPPQRSLPSSANP
jgi:hypothetical protein